jgi:hypothetical protein
LNNDLMLAVLAMDAYNIKQDNIGNATYVPIEFSMSMGITVTVHLTIRFDSHAFGPEWSWLKIFFRNTGVMYLVDCGSDAAS